MGPIQIAWCRIGRAGVWPSSLLFALMCTSLAVLAALRLDQLYFEQPLGARGIETSGVN